MKQTIILACLLKTRRVKTWALHVQFHSSFPGQTLQIQLKEKNCWNLFVACCTADIFVKVYTWHCWKRCLTANWAVHADWTSSGEKLLEPGRCMSNFIPVFLVHSGQSKSLELSKFPICIWVLTRYFFQFGNWSAETLHLWLTPLWPGNIDRLTSRIILDAKKRISVRSWSKRWILTYTFGYFGLCVFWKFLIDVIPCYSTSPW
jgi:hypothetical protein